MIQSSSQPDEKQMFSVRSASRLSFLHRTLISRCSLAHDYGERLCALRTYCACNAQTLDSCPQWSPCLVKAERLRARLNLFRHFAQQNRLSFRLSSRASAHSRQEIPAGISVPTSLANSRGSCRFNHRAKRLPDPNGELLFSVWQSSQQKAE